jgi:hypothetical protein
MEMLAYGIVLVALIGGMSILLNKRAHKQKTAAKDYSLIWVIDNKRIPSPLLLEIIDSPDEYDRFLESLEEDERKLIRQYCLQQEARLEAEMEMLKKSSTINFMTDLAEEISTSLLKLRKVLSYI